MTGAQRRRNRRPDLHAIGKAVGIEAKPGDLSLGKSLLPEGPRCSMLLRSVASKKRNCS
jgi:hypothetical protein